MARVGEARTSQNLTVEDGKVYWTGGVDSSPRVVVGADPDSFHKLSSGYARDKSHAYYHGAPIAGADVATVPFKVIMDCMKHPLTDIGLERFVADYKKAFG